MGRRYKMEQLFKECPVCKGKGLVPYGFYDLNGYFNANNNSLTAYPPTHETCRRCHGGGIIPIPQEITSNFVKYIS